MRCALSHCPLPPHSPSHPHPPTHSLSAYSQLDLDETLVHSSFKPVRCAVLLFVAAVTVFIVVAVTGLRLLNFPH